MYRSHFAVPGLPGPIVVHGFSERSNGFARLTTARPATIYEAPAFGSMCARRPLGLGVPVSHATSIYHQLFQAVPAWRAHRARADAAGGAPASAFVPLVFAHAALGRGKPAAPRRWYGWEFSLRPLTRASADEIAAATSRLLRTRCTCYDAFEAAATPYNPGATFGSSRAALRGFRDAALRRLPAPLPAGPPAGPPAAPAGSGALLFVSRQAGRRGLTNEAALLDAIGREPAAAGRLRRVVLETLPLSEQMVAVSRAVALVAVHGQALAWVPFLPWERARTAVVELSTISAWGIANGCYQAWCATLGVRYATAEAKVAADCRSGVTRRDNAAVRHHKLLACNVTVLDVRGAAAAVARAAAHTAA